MKKVIPFLLFLAIIIPDLYSQRVVYDGQCIASLGANHGVQLGMLRLFENSQKKIAEYNEQIEIKVVQVELIRDKLFKSLKEVNSIIDNSKDMEEIIKISSSIAAYQSDMASDAMEAPELAVTVARCELELVSRTLTIMDYMQMAITGDETNLLDNRQRTEILSNLIHELRVMRGMAYSARRQIRTAKRESIMRTLDVQNFKY